MLGATPSHTDPVWSHLYGASSGGSASGGQSTPGSTPQPPSDQDEPWTELEPLTKVPLMKLWNLIEALRAGGVPVLGSQMRRSGLFSGKSVDVRLRVPQRLVQEARLIVAEHLGVG